MENQLKTIRQLPIGEIITIANTFAESGMFADTKQAAQAFVKIQAGQEIGISPFQSMSGIHIIQGKVTIGAGIMASRVKGSGKYDYKIIVQDESQCSIDFYQGKTKIGNSTFTIEDAKKAGTQNLHKFARNMLFARAVSNGVKWYAPDVFSGPVYVPEEMDFSNDAKTEDVAHTEAVVDKPKKEIFQTLDEKVSDAEGILADTTSVEELIEKFRSLADDVQKDKRIIDLCAEIKLHFTNPVKTPE